MAIPRANDAPENRRAQNAAEPFKFTTDHGGTGAMLSTTSNVTTC